MEGVDGVAGDLGDADGLIDFAGEVANEAAVGWVAEVRYRLGTVNFSGIIQLQLKGS